MEQQLSLHGSQSTLSEIQWYFTNKWSVDFDYFDILPLAQTISGFLSKKFSLIKLTNSSQTVLLCVPVNISYMCFLCFVNGTSLRTKFLNSSQFFSFTCFPGQGYIRDFFT